MKSQFDMDQKTEPVEQDLEKQKRQNQLMYRALAESIVNQLSKSGCSTGQLIEFATEVLDNITNGHRDNGTKTAASAMSKKLSRILRRLITF